MPTPTVPHPLAARVAGTLLAALVVLLAAFVVLLPAGREALAAVPSTVLPGGPDGAEVALDPPVLRTTDGRAEVDLVLGADAPGAVTATFAVVTAAVGEDGTVTAGAPATGATVTRGSRLRPGERLRAVVTTPVDGGPVLLVASVAGATTPDSVAGATTPDSVAGATTPDSGPADASVELATLVLPGPAGPRPEVTVAAADGTVTATVTSAAPLLVSIRLHGVQDTTFPDRLATPDQPVLVRGEAAPWPAPSVVSVTDEEGRIVTADTGRAPLAVLAAVLALLAAGGIGLAVRRRRADGPATADGPVPP